LIIITKCEKKPMINATNMAFSYSYADARSAVVKTANWVYMNPREAFKTVQLAQGAITIATVAAVAVTCPTAASGVTIVAGAAYAIEMSTHGTHYWADVVVGGALYSADLLSKLGMVSGIAVNIATAVDAPVVNAVRAASMLVSGNSPDAKWVHAGLAVARFASLAPAVREGVATAMDAAGELIVAEEKPSLWNALWDGKARTAYTNHLGSQVAKSVWDRVANYMKPTRSFSFADHFAALTARLTNSALRLVEYGKNAVAYYHAGEDFDLVDENEAVGFDYVTIEMDADDEQVALEAAVGEGFGSDTAAQPGVPASMMESFVVVDMPEHNEEESAFVMVEEEGLSFDEGVEHLDAVPLEGKIAPNGGMPSPRPSWTSWTLGAFNSAAVSSPAA
jgi:hypothetical protein